MIIRQGIKMLLFLLFISIVIVNGYAQMMTKEQEDAFRSAKTARIVVKQSYGEAKDVSLPFKDVAQKLLKYAGLKIVKTNSADMTLNIEAEGRAKGSKYGEYYLYSGASLSGTITLEVPNMTPYKQYFKGEIDPPFFLHYFEDHIPHREPSHAPFKQAFREYGSFVTQMFEILRDIHGLKFINVVAKDKDRVVKRNAWIALGKMQDKRAVMPLIALLNDMETDVQKVAAKLLGEIKDERAIKPLIEKLKDTAIEFTVRKALENIGEPAIKPLIEALGDKNMQIREKAAYALGDMGKGRAVDPLIALLKDSNSGVRSAAAAVLGEIKDERAVEPVIALLKDSNDFVQHTAVIALGKIRDERAVGPLIKLLDGHEAPFVSKALANIGEPAIKPLIEALGDKRWKVRHNAVIALGIIGNEQAVEPLIDLLKDSKKSVWIAAAQALGEIKDERAVEPLIALLKDSNSGVRGEAAEALGKIKDERAVEPLVALLKDSHPGVRRTAAKALGEIKDKSAGKPLIFPR